MPDSDTNQLGPHLIALAAHRATSSLNLLTMAPQVRQLLPPSNTSEGANSAATINLQQVTRFFTMLKTSSRSSSEIYQQDRDQLTHAGSSGELDKEQSPHDRGVSTLRLMTDWSDQPIEILPTTPVHRAPPPQASNVDELEREVDQYEKVRLSE